MKVSIQKILEGQQIIASLLDKKLPAATAFRLGRLVSKVDSELKLFDEQRMKIVQELGEELAEEPGKFKIKEENVEKFNEETKALLDVEIEIDVKQLSASEFGDVEISARELLAIEWLVKE